MGGSTDVRGTSSSTATGALPICIEGKAVPNFYLLGAAKCGTTTLAQALFDCGMEGANHYYNYANQLTPVKEPNVFDRLCNSWGSPTCAGIDASEARKTIASWGSDVNCTDAIGFTVSDMTPSSLFAAGLPHLMAGVYGSQTAKLSFVVLIREPLSRWQSQFHYEQQFGNNLAATFEEEVAQAEQMLTPYATYEDIVANRSDFDSRQIGIAGWQRSMYGLMLDGWLNEPSLSSSQFAIFPMKYATDHTRDTIELLASHFNWAGINPSLIPERAAVFNVGHAHHDSPNSEVSRATRYRLQSKYFGPDAEALSSLLADRMPRGLIVGGFTYATINDPTMAASARAAMLRHHLHTWW